MGIDLGKMRQDATKEKGQKPATSDPKKRMLNVEEYLSQHGIAVKEIKRESDRTIYILAHCPFDESHDDASIIQYVDGKLAFNCFHNSCADKHWGDVRRAISGDEPIFSDDGGKQKRESKTDLLIKLGIERFELFHDDDLTAFATTSINGHHETYSLRSKAFRTCLSRLFYDTYQSGVGGQILQDAIGTLEGHAIHGGPCYKVHVRLAATNGKIYIDLGNERFEIVEVSADGWRILNDQDAVKFRRSSGMAPLPYPKEGGRIELLQKYINLENPQELPLISGFTVMCFNPDGPYPILSFTGEQGSAKSSGQRVIKNVTDPSTVPLRSLPRDTRDLAIASKNSFVLAFDNLSEIPTGMSDALCRLATGSGFATRTLHTDEDETIINTKRPIMMNGIENVVRRHDLADRSIVINLAVIPEDKRIQEKDFWNDFDDDAPEIFGAILDGVSCALRNYQSVKLPRLPRMADFAIWATAASPAMGFDGDQFLTAYAVNRADVTRLTLEADVVGAAVEIFMATRTAWSGTATELLNALEEKIDDRTKKLKSWPKGSNVLSGKLTRSATSLRSAGIEVTISRGKKNRIISLEQIPEKTVTTVTGSKNKGEHGDIINETEVTMFKDGIVTNDADRHLFQQDRHTGDDDNDVGDDSEIKTVTESIKNNHLNLDSYGKGDGGGGGDDPSTCLFRETEKQKPVRVNFPFRVVS